MSTMLRTPEQVPSYFACECEIVRPMTLAPDRPSGLLSPATRQVLGRLVRAVQQTIDAKSQSAAAW